jgi:outer membrane protein TolC
MASGAEVYRWESEVARNRQEVIEANAARNVVELEINRLLDRPLEEPFLTLETDLEDPSLITSDERIQGHLDDQGSFRRFRDFNVEEAYANSPEILALDAAIATQNRILLGTRRAFYVPDVTLQAQLDRHLVDGGAGAEEPSPFDAWDWQLALRASLPLFQGGARSAERARASVELERLLAERASLAQRIEQRVRASLHQIGASNAGIALARKSADAAAKNLELVSDAYTRGVVSIIDLLDAQNAAFVSELSAVNANYEFLLDLMEVERAVGCFNFFSASPVRDAYFERLEAYFAAGTSEDR